MNHKQGTPTEKDHMMNKLLKSAVAIVVIAGASTTIFAGESAQAATVIRIPGTTITAPSATRWSDTGAAYTINGGFKVDTRFYGMRHCYFNNAHSSKDGSICFSVLSKTVVVFTSTKTSWTSVKAG